MLKQSQHILAGAFQNADGTALGSPLGKFTLDDTAGDNTDCIRWVLVLH